MEIDEGDCGMPLPLQIGTIARFGARKTALMRVDVVHRYGRVTRYRGEHLTGGTVAAGTSCSAIDLDGADMELWNQHEADRARS